MQKEFGLNWSSFKYRNADLALGRFFSVDPLADKYVYNSTYAFSENKVINGIELEGLEVIYVKNMGKDAPIHKAAVKQKDRNAIHVFAHGNQRQMVTTKFISTGVQLMSDLKQNKSSSKLWKQQAKEKEIRICLHSCRTGRAVTKNGKVIRQSYAQRASGDIHNATGFDAFIAAPDERDWFNGKEMGPFVPQKADENSNYTSSNHKASKKYGNWNIFKNGKLLFTIKHTKGFKTEDIFKMLNLFKALDKKVPKLKEEHFKARKDGVFDPTKNIKVK